MNEVILETMKENDDKFWHLQKQVDDMGWMVFQLEERTDKALVLLGQKLQELKDILAEIKENVGPPIPKPNPKDCKHEWELGKDKPYCIHCGLDYKKISKHTPGRVEMREMLISICKEVYKYWPRNQDEGERYNVFETYMKAKGWDFLKHPRPELWAQERVKKFKNYELQEILRILGVME